jgi:hypothetical protein
MNVSLCENGDRWGVLNEMQNLFPDWNTMQDHQPSKLIVQWEF